MKSTNKMIGLIAGTVAASFTGQALAAENPFSIGSTGETIVLAAAKNAKGLSVLEGKCGAGKCGSQRVRQMMDSNADGRINRSEYVSWGTAQAGNEFDNIANGASSVSSDDVFNSFLEYEKLSDQG